MNFVKSALKGAVVLALIILTLPVTVAAILASMGGDARLLRWVEGWLPGQSADSYIEPVDAWPQPQVRGIRPDVDEEAALN